jgi:hypothetical protein
VTAGAVTNDDQGDSMDKPRTPGPRRATLTRHIAQLFAALAIVTGLSVATAGTAMATNVGEQACHGPGGYTACLLITNLGNNTYHVYVAVDIYMSQQDAQNAVDSGFRPTATLWGADGSSSPDDFLTNLTLTSFFAWSGGIGTELQADVSGRLLNEDDGVDEIIAKVRLYLAGAQRTITCETGQVVSAF